MAIRILIEGADQVGKSTLATALSKRLNLPVKHLGKPGELGYSLAFFTEYFSSSGIYDRAHLGGIVYGEFLGFHKNLLRPFIREALERWMIYNDFIMLVVTADPELLSSRIQQNDREEMCNMADILLANHFYSDLARQTEFNKTHQFKHIHCTNEFPYPDVESALEVLRNTFPSFELQEEDRESSGDQQESVDSVCDKFSSD